jgi:hypothetical protein
VAFRCPVTQRPNNINYTTKVKLLFVVTVQHPAGPSASDLDGPKCITDSRTSADNPIPHAATSNRDMAFPRRNFTHSMSPSASLERQAAQRIGFAKHSRREHPPSRSIPVGYVGDRATPPPSPRRGEGGSGCGRLSLSIFAENGEGGPKGRVGLSSQLSRISGKTRRFPSGVAKHPSRSIPAEGPRRGKGAERSVGGSRLPVPPVTCPANCAG